MTYQSLQAGGTAAEQVRQSPCLYAGQQPIDRPLTEENDPSPLVVSQTCVRGPRLRLLHFNDVYDVYPSSKGVGGAAHFATAMKEKKEADAENACLVFFSGDIFSPSQLSEASRGRQMASLLNLLKVHSACYGNHDLDHGWEWLEVLAGTTTSKWIVSNATMKGGEGYPLANAQRYRIFEWGPQRVLTGIVGLIERDWVDLLHPPDRAVVVYEDYVQAGRRYAQILKNRGCQLVIALTHMRWHNDEKLAREVEDIDLILGGHDHEYGLRVVNGRLIVKSGSDFRDFSSLTLFPKYSAADSDDITIISDSVIPVSLSQCSAVSPKDGEPGETPKTLRRSGPAPSEERSMDCCCAGEGRGEDRSGVSPSSPEPGERCAPVRDPRVRSKEFNEDAVQSTAPSSEHSSNVWTKSPEADLSPVVERLYSAGRWWACCERVSVSVDAYLADEDVEQMLTNCARAFGVSRRTETLGTWPVQVEARFRELRSRDCNCGRWVTDLVRAFADADVGVVCAGSLRADCVFQQGDAVKAFALHELFACAREMRTIAVSGSQMLAMLENSVSRWPQLEGRFLQVSGLRFTFDGNKPPGQRVLHDEVKVLDRQSDSWVAVDAHKMYKVIGSEFLIEGGDGYTMLSQCEEIAVRREGVRADVLEIAELWWRRRALRATCRESVSELHAAEKADGLQWLDRVTIEEESDSNRRIINLASGFLGYDALTRKRVESEVNCNVKDEGEYDAGGR